MDKEDNKPPVKRGRGRPRKTTGASKTDAISNAKPQKQVASGGAWMAHVKKTYEAGKKKNPSYAYKTAMSDAKKTYKKPK
tara:strand:+ start:1501 stop:1740 length:240 start_codon:yes stop_codon:yes gene_type:complete